MQKNSNVYFNLIYLKTELIDFWPLMGSATGCKLWLNIDILSS